MPNSWRWLTESYEIKNAGQAFNDINAALLSTGALALLDYSKRFVQMVNCRVHSRTLVLLQHYGDKLRPIAHYSSKLDSFARALPTCVQAVVAASISIQASTELALFQCPHSYCKWTWRSCPLRDIWTVWPRSSHNPTSRLKDAPP